MASQSNLIFYSHAILGYLVNQYGKDDSLYPKEPKKRAVIDQRLHFDTGVLFPRLAAFCVSSVKMSDYFNALMQSSTTRESFLSFVIVTARTPRGKGPR